MAKTIVVSNDEVTAAIQKEAKALQPHGLTGAADVASLEIADLISGGICALYRPLRKRIKEAVAGNFIETLAFNVIDKVIMSKICPDAGRD